MPANRRISPLEFLVILTALSKFIRHGYCYLNADETMCDQVSFIDLTTKFIVCSVAFLGYQYYSRHELTNALEVIFINLIDMIFDQTDFHFLDFQGYKNAATFQMLTSVEDIPADKLLVLDGYAFDIDELCAYVDVDLHNIHRNPHAFKHDFSQQAKKTLREHPVFSRYVEKYNAQVAAQNSKVKPETITELVVMLQELNKTNRDGSEHSFANDKAYIKFNEYMSEKLSGPERTDLMNYIIEMPLKQGGYQRMDFAGALSGGGPSCVVVLQTFMWRFVVVLRPMLAALVPAWVLGQGGYDLLAGVNKPHAWLNFFNRRVELSSPLVAEDERRPDERAVMASFM